MDLLNFADWRNLKFGLRPPTQTFPAYQYRADDPMSGFRVIEHYDSIHQAPDNQTLGSCSCDTATGIMEVEIFRTHGEVVQLNYDRLYRAVREDLYNDDRDEGAQAHEPFVVAKRRGWIPETATQHRPQLNAADICLALAKGPIGIAVSIHEGWSPRHLHPDNAAVNEALDIGLRPFTNGHMMMAAATTLHNGVPGLVPRQSWGDIGINRTGLVSVSFRHYLKWAMDRPVSYDLGPDWKKFRGWEELCI